MLNFGFYNMDCMDGMKEFPDKYFDLAIVDPPYRDIEENKPFQQMRDLSSTKKVFGNGKPTQKYWDELKRVSKNQIVFGANNFGYSFKGYVCWDKGVRGSDRYSQVEIASLSEQLSTVSTIYSYSTYQNYKKIHPTQKPVALYEWLLNRFAKPEDVILDTHVGSASSLIACRNTNHKFVGFELDETFYRLASERLEQEKAQMNIFDYFIE